MVNYVDEDKFFSWYEQHSRKPLNNKNRLLDDLYREFCDTGRSYYVLKSGDSTSGSEEHFPFRFEDLGCCGASTLFIYF